MLLLESFRMMFTTLPFGDVLSLVYPFPLLDGLFTHRHTPGVRREGYSFDIIDVFREPLFNRVSGDEGDGELFVVSPVESMPGS